MNVVMKRSKGSKNATAATSPSPSKPRSEEPEAVWNRIACKAYELWDTRGRHSGSALQDWLDAEQIVMGELREGRG
jgi:hypothetical protein